MRERTERVADRRARASIVHSYRLAAGAFTRAFLAARTHLLPLDRYHEELPREGRILEIGCGHGLVAQYLARRAPSRVLVGYDPDPRRIEVARRAALRLGNLEFLARAFGPGCERGVEGILLVGVLCLVADDGVDEILRAARDSLRPGGTLLLSDFEERRGELVYELHFLRERLLGWSGFTRGSGLHVRGASEWRDRLARAGFSRVVPFEARVPLHSTFHWKAA